MLEVAPLITVQELSIDFGQFSYINTFSLLDLHHILLLSTTLFEAARKSTLNHVSGLEMWSVPQCSHRNCVMVLKPQVQQTCQGECVTPQSRLGTKHPAEDIRYNSLPITIMQVVEQQKEFSSLFKNEPPNPCLHRIRKMVIFFSVTLLSRTFQFTLLGLFLVWNISESRILVNKLPDILSIF